MSDSTQLLQRLCSLAVRQRLSLGVMASTRPADLAVVLAAAGCTFGVGEILSEREVNERLLAWLAGTGAMLAVDHVDLRRWLVDTGVLARDGYGRAYTRGEPRPDIGQAMAALAPHDLATLVREARNAEAARREARKAQFAKAAT
jgi:hypothetical protein